LRLQFLLYQESLQGIIGKNEDITSTVGTHANRVSGIDEPSTVSTNEAFLY
jgi:hypothetical protein